MILKKNKGFTLVEMLVVLAIVAILAVFVIPNFTTVLSENRNKAMQIQENNIVEAAKLYVQDYCLNPIDSSYTCDSSLTEKTDNPNGHLYYVVTTKNFTLVKLVSAGYIDNVKTSDGATCSGYVKITGNSSTAEMTYKAYISCGNNGSIYKTAGY